MSCLTNGLGGDVEEWNDGLADVMNSAFSVVGLGSSSAALFGREYVGVGDKFSNCIVKPSCSFVSKFVGLHFLIVVVRLLSLLLSLCLLQLEPPAGAGTAPLAAVPTFAFATPISAGQL